MRRSMGNGELSAKGFTFIEVIGVLVILSILAVVFASHIYWPAYELRVQAELLKTHLRFCQFKALSDIDNQSVSSWGMSFGSNSYTLMRNGENSPIKLPGPRSPR